MFIRSYKFLLLSFLITSCEKDDICLQGSANTNRITIEFINSELYGQRTTLIQLLIKSNRPNKSHFNKIPSWVLINNKEIKISSTEIRKQRELLRG